MGRPTPRRVAAVMVVMLVMVALTVPASARAQNDWQYPDPYFGILEIEKSRSVTPAPRTAGGPRRPAGASRPKAGTAAGRGWMPPRARSVTRGPVRTDRQPQPSR